MTPKQRKSAFMKLYRQIPLTNIDKIRLICEILGYKENTIRLFPCKTENGRTIPETRLHELRAALVKRKVIPAQ